MNSTIYLHLEIGQEQIHADSKFSHIWEDKQHLQLVQELLSLGRHSLATHNSHRGTDDAASEFWCTSFYSKIPQTLQTATIFSYIFVQLLNSAEAHRSDSQLDFLAAGINIDSPPLKDETAASNLRKFTVLQWTENTATSYCFLPTLEELSCCQLT